MITTIKNKNPLVLCLTNEVTKNLCANTLLAIGASPIMSHAKKEIPELIAISSALYINIGTLTDEFIELALSAIAAASQHNTAILLDPVGVGASRYRKHSALTLINAAEALIIKGNASEIMALIDFKQNAKGVDSNDESDNAVKAAKILLEKPNIQHVIITGRTDYVISQNKLHKNTYGTTMMSKVTGMGCALGGVLTAALASNENAHDMLVSTLVHYTRSAEIAEEKSKGPGSFANNFLDELAI